MKLHWKIKGQVEKRHGGNKSTKAQQLNNQSRNDQKLANVLMFTQF